VPKRRHVHASRERQGQQIVRGQEFNDRHGLERPRGVDGRKIAPRRHCGRRRPHHASTRMRYRGTLQRLTCLGCVRSCEFVPRKSLALRASVGRILHQSASSSGPTKPTRENQDCARKEMNESGKQRAVNFASTPIQLPAQRSNGRRTQHSQVTPTHRRQRRQHHRQTNNTENKTSACLLGRKKALC
jgi:hypothetical protein